MPARSRWRSGPTSFSPTTDSPPKTSSSTPTSSRWPPVSKPTTPTPGTSSKPSAGSSETCPTPRFRAACRIYRSPSGATTPCARPCIRCFSTTPSKRVWTWRSSIPRCCKSTATSNRDYSNGSRMLSSAAAQTPPNASRNTPRNSPKPPRRRRKIPTPGARSRSASASNTPCSRAWPTTSSRTRSKATARWARPWQ